MAPLYSAKPTAVPATEESTILPRVTPLAAVARLATAGMVAAGVAALAACGSSTPTVDPHAVLRQAKQVIDATPALHFTISSSGVSGGTGTLITGGAGDAKRPDEFRGTLRVMQSGFSVAVNIVSIGGRFLVQLPFSAQYEQTDPSKYGFGDPAILLDPDKGLSSLLVNTLSASMGDRDRLNGAELDEVDVSLPGDRVGALLTTADKSKPVQGRIGIDPGSHQIRRVVLTGPFFDATKDSTFTLVLDSYGENVTITPPPG